MALYKLTRFNVVLRTNSDGSLTSIPMNDSNSEYQQYLVWLSDGNTPDPADPAPRITSTVFEPYSQLTTADAVEVELYRLPIPTLTIMDVYIRVYGVDRGNGNFKKFRREAAIRRLGAASTPAVVGSVEIPATDVGTPTWTIAPAFDGNDLVVKVTGAAGRMIDWLLFAELRRFTPGGI